MVVVPDAACGEVDDEARETAEYDVAPRPVGFTGLEEEFCGLVARGFHAEDVAAFGAGEFDGGGSFEGDWFAVDKEGGAGGVSGDTDELFGAVDHGGAGGEEKRGGDSEEEGSHGECMRCCEYRLS